MYEFTCKVCGQHDFKTYKSNHPLLLHWVLNPGLAINELVFGQRVPKECTYCKNCGVSDANSYVFCKKCNDFIFYGEFKKKFGNYSGLKCPMCGDSIPCLRNYTARLILFLLWPVIAPIKYWLKKA
jgi:hypothetical protein